MAGVIVSMVVGMVFGAAIHAVAFNEGVKSVMDKPPNNVVRVSNETWLAKKRRKESGG